MGDRATGSLSAYDRDWRAEEPTVFVGGGVSSFSGKRLGDQLNWWNWERGSDAVDDRWGI